MFRVRLTVVCFAGCGWGRRSCLVPTPRHERTRRTRFKSSRVRTYLEPEVKHPVTLDHYVWVLQQLQAVDVAEISFAASEDHRCYINSDLVNEAECKGLPTDCARAYRHHAVPSTLLGFPHGSGDVVEERDVSFGVPPVRLGSVRDDEKVLARGRLGVPTVRQVEKMSPLDRRADAGPEGPDVRQRNRGDTKGGVLPLQVFVDDRLVSVEVPIEQWPDVVVLISDEAIHRRDRVHHHNAHDFSSLAEPDPSNRAPVAMSIGRTTQRHERAFDPIVRQAPRLQTCPVGSDPAAGGDLQAAFWVAHTRRSWRRR